jgi:quercetin dioxygenase-like cupin family protein
MISTKAPEGRITHLEQLPRYAPPGHWGTLNARLVERYESDGYEMILGAMDPDGGSELHRHDLQYQAMFILEGEALIEIGDDQSCVCPAGSVIEIPPGIHHRIVARGVALRFIVVFSPPLSTKEAKAA